MSSLELESHVCSSAASIIDLSKSQARLTYHNQCAGGIVLQSISESQLECPQVCGYDTHSEETITLRREETPNYTVSKVFVSRYLADFR